MIISLPPQENGSYRGFSHFSWHYLRGQVIPSTTTGAAAIASDCKVKGEMYSEGTTN